MNRALLGDRLDLSKKALDEENIRNIIDEAHCARVTVETFDGHSWRKIVSMSTDFDTGIATRHERRQRDRCRKALSNVGVR